VKNQLKSLIFQLLGKDPEAVVVTFCTGPQDLAKKMVAEIQALIPDRRHYIVTEAGTMDDCTRATQPPHITWLSLEPATTWSQYRRLRAHFRRLRIALAPVLFAGPPSALRRAATLLAPTKILAYNQQLERHHLRLATPIASTLFLKGIPADRIYLRPKWFPGTHEASVYPDTYITKAGRPLSERRKRIAIVSPYVPYPLSHGGAVRIFHLLREAAQEYDLFLFAFQDNETDADLQVLQEFCAAVTVLRKTRYREPRWSTLYPPEVHEFNSPAMHRALSDLDRQYQFDLRQIEYTHMATYAGDILVEHDVTFDLFHQMFRRKRSLLALWNFLRWRRYELTVVPKFRRVVTMSTKDGALLSAGPGTRVIENGVDVTRFTPEPETSGQRLLFVGSFRHFPNIEAYRFFTATIWPEVTRQFPEMRLTVIAGPDHLLHWSQFTRTAHPEPDSRIDLQGFVADLRPLYAKANLVIVPTTVSAGTNVKVLEAMAMERAIVSTTSGCAGLEVKHRDSIWIADSPAEFIEAIAHLTRHPALRSQVAATARRIAAHTYDWKVIGEKQRLLFRELLGTRPQR
jgi:glycosyltransferase involved in cell wall biosynthesis